MLSRICVIAAMAALGGAAGAAEVSFTKIVDEFSSGVPWLKPGIPIPISDSGKVAFATESVGTFADQLHTWDAGILTPIALTAGGYDSVRSIAVSGAGDVAFVANRTIASDVYRGVYKTSTSGAAITTYHQDLQNGGGGGSIPGANFVAMSENGTVGFSNIVSAAGALYRGPITGSPTAIRTANGVFFNTQRSDINNSGAIATQFEYGSPVGPLSRAIIVIDDEVMASVEAPDLYPTREQTKTAIEQTHVGVQPMPSINSSGQIAFALNTSITMNFYDPPNNTANPLVQSITLDPGVYVTQPVLMGQLPRTYTQIANLDGDFESFGRVVINDAGVVIFEAGLDDNPNSGIFMGGDPVADKLLITGENLDPGPVISLIQLGDLNNSNQFTFLVSRDSSDRQIWIGQIPEPVGLSLLAPAAMLLLRRKMRN